MEIFYRLVTQALLLFGSKNWVLLVVMDRMVEGTHTGFMRKIKGKRVWRKTDRTWVIPREEVVLEAVRTQLSMAYIRRRQEVVAQWVSLRTIFEVWETGY